jgi:hypothetical protein
MRRFCASLAVIVFALVVTAPGAHAGGLKSNRWEAVNTTAASTPTGENVDLTGKLHLVSKLSKCADGATLKLKANLANTKGDGQSSNAKYKATGADKTDPPLVVATNPCGGSVNWSPTFRFFTQKKSLGNCLANDPCELHADLTLNFDANGKVTSVTQNGWSVTDPTP